jgi:hypothetical protein
VVVEFVVGETLDAIRAEENFREVAARRDQISRLKTIKWTLYGRIDR